MATSFKVGDEVVLIEGEDSWAFRHLIRDCRLKIQTVYTINSIEKTFSPGSGHWPEGHWFEIKGVKGFRFPLALFKSLRPLTKSEAELQDINTMGVRFGYPLR